MTSGPIQSERRLQEARSYELQTQLERAQSEGVQLRREVLRWKMLARQHEDRLKEIESSVYWRIFGIIRIFPELRHRRKLLLLVGMLVCVTLPIWPLLVILMCFPSGRNLIRRALRKIRPLHDLMGFVRQRILSRIGDSRDNEHDIKPLIYHRPGNVESPTAAMTNERLNWLLLQQLCPQRRVLLQGYGLTRNNLVRDRETPELRSLSRTEASILGISAVSHLNTTSKVVC
jgi:hypothetical protein